MKASISASRPLPDQVGGCAVLLHPVYEFIRAHVFAGARVHGDETPVPLKLTRHSLVASLWCDREAC